MRRERLCSQVITCLDPPPSERPVRKDTRNGRNTPALRRSAVRSVAGGRPALRFPQTRGTGALLRTGNVLYNSLVRPDSFRFLRAHLCPLLLAATLGVTMAQQAPAPAGARVLLLPRKIVSGEHATLAVLDLAGRLTPGVHIKFSDGESVTTDVTGRALFVAPLNPGTIFAGIEGRSGRVSSSIVTPAEVPQPPWT